MQDGLFLKLIVGTTKPYAFFYQKGDLRSYCGESKSFFRKLENNWRMPRLNMAPMTAKTMELHVRPLAPCKLFEWND